jgi:hypothetical protein
MLRARLFERMESRKSSSLLFCMLQLLKCILHTRRLSSHLSQEFRLWPRSLPQCRHTPSWQTNSIKLAGFHSLSQVPHVHFKFAANEGAVNVDTGLTSGYVPLPSDSQRQTIYALATPPGRGGVAIIRVSGPETRAVMKRIVRPNNVNAKVELSGEMQAADNFGNLVSKVFEDPRKMIRCSVVDPLTGEDLDDGLAVFFQGSYFLQV